MKPNPASSIAADQNIELRKQAPTRQVHLKGNDFQVIPELYSHLLDFEANDFNSRRVESDNRTCAFCRNSTRLPRLLPRWGKHYRDRGIHLDRHAIHQRRLVSPLQYDSSGPLRVLAVAQKALPRTQISDAGWFQCSV